MAVVGLKQVTLALLDDAGAIIAGTAGLSIDGTFPITDEMLGTKTANITNISGAPTLIYGNDGQVDASIAKGTPSVAFAFNNLPASVKNLVLGRVNDSLGGYTQGKIPKVAALVQTTEIGTLDPQYIGFASGKMTETALNLQTNTNAEVRVDDALTFTAFSVTKWGGQAIKFFDGGDAKFSVSTMMSDIFTGYIAPTTTTAPVTTTTTAPVTTTTSI